MFASVKLHGAAIWCCSSAIFYEPLLNAQLTREPKSCSRNFSSNFSQTLGTPKKIVGFTLFRVLTNDPYIASGLAKYTEWPTAIC